MSLLPPNEERRRFGLIRVSMVVLVTLFVGHLSYYQIIDAPNINKISSDKRSVTRVILASRGSILDRSGNVLARSVFTYDVNVVPAHVANIPQQVNGNSVTVTVDQVAQEMSIILGQTKDDILRKMAGTGLYANIAKDVDATVYSQLKALNVPWVYFDKKISRLYPNGAVAGNILGFITADGTTMAGTERKMNDCLAGVNGKETFDSGADGIRIPDSAVTTVMAKNGGNLKLTLDTNLQYFSQQVLENAVRYERADYGTAVVIEVKTGKLLVAAEAPTVDPNNPGAAKERDRQSKIFTTSYEPGSTMKSITAATAIDTGKATITSKVVAPYKLKTSFGAWIKDSEKHPTMHLTLAGILRDSSNTGIIQIGAKVDRSVRVAYMKKFGLGQATSINFPGEASGILGDTKNWDLLTDKTSMFGQGIAVTPIQMAYVYQAIANGGLRLSPKLYESCTAADGTVTKFQQGPSSQVIKASTARDTIDMLEKVVEQGHVGKTAAIAGYRVAGKSGTAQIQEGGTYGYLHAISFIGMAPAEDPKYVVAVMLYKSRRTTSSLGATPWFKQIMQQVLRTYRIPPSTTKSRNIPTEW